MTKLALTPLKSSALTGMHHDPATGTLTVEFTNGKRWQYEGVPPEKVMGLEGNASPGRYFSDRIRGLYPGREIT